MQLISQWEVIDAVCPKNSREIIGPEWNWTHVFHFHFCIGCSSINLLLLLFIFLLVLIVISEICLTDDKRRIKPLDKGLDYFLWRIRVNAAIGAKSIDKEFPDLDHVSDEKKIQTSTINVAALSHQVLHVVCLAIGRPNDMIDELTARYDWTKTSSKFSKMFNSVSVRHRSMEKDMEKHTDRVAKLFEESKSMGTVLEWSLCITILVA